MLFSGICTLMQTKTQNLGAYKERRFFPRVFGMKHCTFKLNREVLGEF